MIKVKINEKYRTEWEGLWYHPKYHSYSSTVIMSHGSVR